jgi:hypothetical protein
MPVSGPALFAVGFGTVLVYAGFKGYSIPATIQDVITGKAPATGQSNVAPIPVAQDIANAAAAAAGSTTLGGGASSGGSAPAGNTGAANAGAAANQATAKMLAISMGHADWTTGTNWSDWVSLWNQESGWNIDAANPTSSARGIAQNIQGYGPSYLQGNAVSQITWGINYIAGRYGNPTAAWAHEVADNWY